MARTRGVGSAAALMVLVVLASLGSFGFVAPAQAGLFDDNEARQAVERLRVQVEAMRASIDNRFGKVEGDAADKRAIVELASSIDALRAEVSRLRGQIEVLQNQTEQLDKRQRDLYVDLDNRVRKIEQAPQAVAPPPAAAPDQQAAARPPVAEPANEPKLYEGALNQFKLGNYAVAIQQFEGFSKSYPNSSLVPSAQYWVGNAYYALRDYKSAIATQRNVIAMWPDNAKAPDAMLNIASSQSELGDATGARSTLRELINKYPTSAAADQAKQRLARRT